METARPCAPEPRRQGPSQVRFRVREGGKTPGFYGLAERIPVHWDWMAEEPVSSEPVSAPKFPAISENTGNCAILSAGSVFQAPEKPSLQQWLRGKFPTHP